MAIKAAILVVKHYNLNTSDINQYQARGYKTFLYSTQLSTKFILLINVKINVAEMCGTLHDAYNGRKCNSIVERNQSFLHGIITKPRFLNLIKMFAYVIICVTQKTLHEISRLLPSEKSNMVRKICLNIGVYLFSQQPLTKKIIFQAQCLDSINISLLGIKSLNFHDVSELFAY